MTHLKLSHIYIFFFYRLIIGLIFITFLYSSGLGQELFYEQFTDADGLPSMQTYEMAQDSNGVLWIGTENGLVSYDGESFSRYSHDDFINNDITEIQLDKNGRVYFLNLSNQLAYVEDDEVEIVNTSSIEGDLKDCFILQDTFFITVRNNDLQKSTIYTLNEIGTHHFEFQETPSRYLFKQKEGLSALYLDLDDKTLSIDTNEFNIVDGSLDIYSPNTSRVVLLENGRCLYVEAREVIYEIDLDLFHLLEKKMAERMLKIKHKFFAIYQDQVMLYDTNSKDTITYFRDIFINTLFLDREESLWISTRNQGLIQVPNAFMQFEFQGRELLKDIAINDIINDKSGNVLVASQSGEVYAFSKNKNLKNYSRFPTSSRPISFFEFDDTIYGISTKLFLKFDPESFVAQAFYKESTVLKSIMIKDDALVVGSKFGIFIIDKNELRSINFKEYSPKYLIGQWISALHYNAKNEMLIVGTMSGLYYSSFDDPIYFKEFETNSRYSVSCIVEDETSRVWIGTQSSGILLIDGDRVVEKFNSGNGLDSDIIRNLQLVDNQLVVTSAAGIKTIDLIYETIGSTLDLEGIVSEEVDAFAVIEDEYWIGTKSGLIILPKERFLRTKISPPILTLGSIYLNGSLTEFTNGFELSHDENTILINYNNVTLNYNSDKSIKYRINRNSEWTYSTDPLVRLQSLKPGSYTVEAIGINKLDYESEIITTSFKILPPWWETTWARIGGLIILFGLFQIIFLVRSRRIRKEEAVKRDYLTQINRIKDQALQLQMNPHFIFNSLNAIQGFIGTDEEEKAMNFLARFARLIRLIFEHSKGNSISLEDEIEFIQLYIDLEKLRFKDKVEVQLNIDPALDELRDVIKVPPLLIQPIAENSFKHGLFHKKGKGHLNIDYILEEENVLKIIVQDDGIGRKKAATISNPDKQIHVSSGIKTTKERIELLNFERKKAMNTIKIEDLYSESGAPNGTKTTIYIAI